MPTPGRLTVNGGLTAMLSWSILAHRTAACARDGLGIFGIANHDGSGRAKGEGSFARRIAVVAILVVLTGATAVAGAIGFAPEPSPETTAARASDPAVAAIAPKGDRETVRTESAPVAEPVATRPVVVIDPGHGGGDAGTVSPATGTPEKTVVLEVARVLIQALEETGRYDVRTTRSDDVFVPLGRRVAIAREAKADLLLSIHADAEYDHSVRGATVYTVSEKPSDAQAAALAAKENAADAAVGHVAAEAENAVEDILAELTLRETRRFSLLAARDILEEYRRHGRLVKGAAHRQAGLKVLRAHDVPSVLVEIGFLSNKQDEALMTSSAWRQSTAQSLVAAIDRFFAARGVPGAARAADRPR